MRDLVLDRILDADSASGSSNALLKRIRMHTQLDDQQEGEVYIHELVELINDLFELKLPHHKIQTLALALHQALTSGEGRLKK